MATVTPVLWTHKPRPNKHCPIWLRFTDSHRTLYASLGIFIHPRFWNEAKREVRKGHPLSAEMNALIQKRLTEVGVERIRLLSRRETVSAEALKAAVAMNGQAAPPCYLSYARAFVTELEQRGNIARFVREKTVLNKLEAFAGSPLPFAKMTPGFLQAFETHLVSAPPRGLGNKSSTAQGNMKVIRIHYRRALREGVVPRESDPFLGYTAPKAERSERHRLTEKELSAIEALDLGGTGPAAPLIARTRDAFLFALYNCGIRFADVAQLTCGNIREEAGPEGATVLRLRYQMGKTGKRVTLGMMERAKVIARAYLVDEHGKPKKPSAFLFPMLSAYDLSTPRKLHNALGSQNNLANKYLKKIAALFEAQGTVTFHVSRHTFAEICRRRNWRIYEISKALGHSTMRVTEGYMAGSDEELVDAKLSTLLEEVAE